MPRALVGQLDGPAASPTLAPSLAPRTETTTAAPASAPNSHPEVRSLPELMLLIYPARLNLSLLITLLNISIHPLVNVLKCISFSLCANIKLLLTYSCTFGCYISWARIQLIQTSSLNSLTHFLQVGGLKLAVRLTWMAYITQHLPVWFATMALSGTTGRVQIWWLPWQPWWSARHTSDAWWRKSHLRCT